MSLSLCCFRAFFGARALVWGVLEEVEEGFREFSIPKP